MDEKQLSADCFQYIIRTVFPAASRHNDTRSPVTHTEITAHLRSLGDREYARHSLRYFKAEPGGYGHGDKFLGLRVPVVREAVKKFSGASLDTAATLLKSAYHEVRLFALLLLVEQFGRSNAAGQEKIFRLYLEHTSCINNWDLVDGSAPYIVGHFLRDRDRSILYQLARSESLWERRIAILATFHYIRYREYDDALCIMEILLHDPEDLIHKATGWMLREIGKRDKSVATAFLRLHQRTMPRTALRYAIEHFKPAERRAYLQGKA